MYRTIRNARTGSEREFFSIISFEIFYILSLCNKGRPPHHLHGDGLVLRPLKRKQSLLWDWNPYLHCHQGTQSALGESNRLKSVHYDSLVWFVFIHIKVEVSVPIVVETALAFRLTARKGEASLLFLQFELCRYIDLTGLKFPHEGSHTLEHCVHTWFHISDIHFKKSSSLPGWEGQSQDLQRYFISKNKWIVMCDSTVYTAHYSWRSLGRIGTVVRCRMYCRAVKNHKS